MPISLGELAARFGCDVDGDPKIEVETVGSLAGAGPNAISFLSDSRFRKELASTKAAAVVLRRDDAANCPAASLVCEQPYLVFARIAADLHPAPELTPGIHASAVIADSAAVSASARIDAHVSIGERATIGEHVHIGPGCVVGDDCEIGDGCRLKANVTLARDVTIGKRSVVHPGAVIGADGFGNVSTPDGWVKVPQLGGVRIGSDVEIGANTTIDCGALDDTVLGDGVRIDNLCMIGHNVRIGAHTALAAQAGIAGSAIIGERCMFAGQSGSVGHVTICDDVVVSGKSMVTKDITEPGVYSSGWPALPVRDWNRLVARLRRLGTLEARIRKPGQDEK